MKGNVKSSSDEVLEKAKSKREREDRSLQWQLTENNPSYSKQEAVERLARIGTALYVIGCSEVGESGTSHIHAYAVYKNAIELSSLKKRFPRAHFEHVRGSIHSNVEYISKSDSEPYEVGEKPLVVSSWNSDVSSEVVALIIDSGLSPIEIMKKYPRYCNYVVKNFRNLMSIYTEANY